ncbi:MAG: hypothetical protein IPJ01_10165 [Micavibrio sp.]|nr:hypothetical protein [Micavibrio sp.]
MKNLKDLFVSKEIAIKLKEKGFDETCLAVYRGFDLYFDKMICGYVSDLSENTEFSTNSDLNRYDINKKEDTYWITAPMLVQVIDWLREKHNVELGSPKNIIFNGGKRHFRVSIYKIGETKKGLLQELSGFNEYYEALNTAVEQALKLI